MINEIKLLLQTQKNDIKDMGLTRDEASDFIFSEGDIVEQYLIDNDIAIDSVNLEDLRDLQHQMISEL